MNIDLLPFSAFALESYGTAAPSRGDTHTLTLGLALVTAHTSREIMSGTATMNGVSPEVSSLHAAVLPVDGCPLTITF
jgi:hypothetical protein